jgi:hypothetical protein
MKNGVANIHGEQIFERTGTIWTQSPTNLPSGLQGSDIEIDAGRILDVDFSHVGLITNDATADFDNFFAYQP